MGRKPKPKRGRKTKKPLAHCAKGFFVLPIVFIHYESSLRPSVMGAHAGPISSQGRWRTFTGGTTPPSPAIFTDGFLNGILRSPFHTWRQPLLCVKRSRKLNIYCRGGNRLWGLCLEHTLS